MKNQEFWDDNEERAVLSTGAYMEIREERKKDGDEVCAQKNGFSHFMVYSML